MSRLTVEEARVLADNLEKLELQALDIRRRFKESDERTSFCSGGEFEDLPNYDLNIENVRVRSEISRLRRVLNEAIIVEGNSAETIDLGSKFVATTIDNKGNELLRSYMLLGEGVTDISFLDNEYIPASIHSPFGKSVLGKKVNDKFSFLSPNGLTKGVIESIVSEKELESSDKKPLVKTK